MFWLVESSTRFSELKLMDIPEAIVRKDFDRTVYHDTYLSSYYYGFQTKGDMIAAFIKYPHLKKPSDYEFGYYKSSLDACIPT